MLSKVGVATRALVVVLALAKRYELLLTVNRGSFTEQLAKAYRKLLLTAIRRPPSNPQRTRLWFVASVRGR